MKNNFAVHIFTFIIIYFINGSLLSQGLPPTTEYSLDTYDTYFKNELVFNSPITINVKSPKNVKLGNKGYIFSRESKKFIHKIRKNTFDFLTIHSIDKGDDKNNNYVLKADKLLPNRSYVFLLQKSMDENTINELDNINNQLFIEDLNNDFKNRTALEQKYNEIICGIDNSHSSEIDTIINKHKIGSRNFDIYYSKVFKSQVHPELKNLKETYKVIGHPKDTKEFIDQINIADIKAIVDNLENIKINIDKKDHSYLSKIELLERINKKGNLKELLYGIIPINLEEHAEEIDYSAHLSKRKKNLTDFKSLFEKLVEVSLDIEANNKADKKAEDLADKCIVVLKNNTKVLKYIDKIEEVLSNPDNEIHSFRVVEGTTIPAKYADHIGSIIKSDIGVSTIFTREAETFGFRSNPIRPYFGLNIHPWKLNDDASFENIPFHNRLFVQLGLTIGTIEDDGVRTDLFNTNNLLVGAGLLINRSVHFSIGTILYKAEDINPLLDSQDTRFGLYGSIGIHPNLNTIISSFTGLISR